MKIVIGSIACFFKDIIKDQAQESQNPKSNPNHAHDKSSPDAYPSRARLSKGSSIQHGRSIFA